VSILKKGFKIVIFLILLIFLGFGIKYYDLLFFKSNSVQKVLFEADFDSGDSLTEMDFQYSGNKTAKIVNIGGRRAVKISLHRFKDEVSYRSEIMPRLYWKNEISYHSEILPRSYWKKKIFFSRKRPYAIIGREYRYHILIYLPNDWKFDSYEKILMQWHGFPDRNLSEKSRNPPIALRIQNGNTGVGSNYIIRIRSDSNDVTSPNGPYEIDEEIDIGSIVEDLGKWTEWVFQIKWSFESNGSLVVWKDGDIVLERKKQANTFNDKLGPFWKFGVYIPHWIKELNVQRTGFEKYTAYFDNVSIVEIIKVQQSKRE